MNASTLASSLPARLIRELQKLAKKYQPNGVELFVFGSFAQGKQYPTSDLDLGVEWRDKPDPKPFPGCIGRFKPYPPFGKLTWLIFPKQIRHLDESPPHIRYIYSREKSYSFLEHIFDS